ncbi:laminin subunit gamma-2 [Amia ocellicauda]|uniref:laminin subunit gamma-2 n=1 Tax=Amia ocellicauda TaxID=2972642 RepID=UPI00346458DB
MRTGWMIWSGLLFLTLPAVFGTFRYDPDCNCNGKAVQCARDSEGQRCLNCIDNTDGRNCERCKSGYFQQRAGDRCHACSCNPLGSVSSECDSYGRCSCRPGVEGDKCERCQSGALVTHAGCAQRCKSRVNGQLTDNRSECMACFCYGHSTQCTSAEGFTAHAITSTFENSSDGWRAAYQQGSKVHFGWSHKHRDIEVVSRDAIPVYLYAPDKFLGNQVLSYSQNFSFALRVDRGRHQPSPLDLVLEGGGLRVSAPLADLGKILPCGQKNLYTFRLDEQADSKWQPRLSALQFQTLLQNLTAIKIRGTYGENSRGYLDDVKLMSALRGGPGVPVLWVEKCNCPPGYEGQFCETCAPGYKRNSPSSGPFSACVPCDCRGGSCDPETGDCYSGDENRGDEPCPVGYYNNPLNPSTCLPCPCARGVSCSLPPGTLNVKCSRCSPGITGALCDMCEDGFYGDPLGKNGPVRPCQRCQCNGKIDINSVGNCDRLTGECLKCLYNTTGFYCEQCMEGFFRRAFLIDPAQICTPCNCSPLGSRSNTCNTAGQCQCREGFEGLKCERTTCPACYDQVKYQIERYSNKLRDVEMLFKKIESGNMPVNNAEMERALRTAERAVAEMEKDTAQLTGLGTDLQTRLANVKSRQSSQSRTLQAVSQTTDNMNTQARQYQGQVSDIKQLISEARRILEKTKTEMRKIEIPSADIQPGTNSLSGLAIKATTLADKHREDAATIEQLAKGSLSDADKALTLMRSVINGENTVTGVIGDLRTRYNKDVDKVKEMDNQAASVSYAAGEESKTAADALRQISALGLRIPDADKGQIEQLMSDADGLRRTAERSLSGYQNFQDGVKDARSQAEDLLLKGRAAQQIPDKLLARANAAKAKAAASLTGIQMNVNGVEDVLGKLKGFDGQINTNKAEADIAMNRIPFISNIIGDAVQANTQTESILDATDDAINKVMLKVGELGDVVDRMEGARDTLRASTGLLRDATNFRNDLNDLKTQSLAVTRDLNTERTKANQDNQKAKQVTKEASAAYDKAVRAKDAVGDTLLTIKNLLNAFDQPGRIDETKLTKLEESLADASSKVNGQLKPRLQQLEQMEARQRERINGLNQDIDTILLDIANLELIQKTIPEGCYNSPPIERP